jgi:hypothetical protein
MKFVQSCDSKECYNIEKGLVGIKNVDIITRIHEYNEDTSEIKCMTCGKISYANKSSELKKENKIIAKNIEKIEKAILINDNKRVKNKNNKKVKHNEIERDEPTTSQNNKINLFQDTKSKPSKASIKSRELRNRIESGLKSNQKQIKSDNNAPIELPELFKKSKTVKNNKINITIFKNPI